MPLQLPLDHILLTEHRFLTPAAHSHAISNSCWSFPCYVQWCTGVHPHPEVLRYSQVLHQGDLQIYTWALQTL